MQPDTCALRTRVTTNCDKQLEQKVFSNDLFAQEREQMFSGARRRGAGAHLRHAPGAARRTACSPWPVRRRKDYIVSPAERHTAAYCRRGALRWRRYFSLMGQSLKNHAPAGGYDLPTAQPGSFADSAGECALWRAGADVFLRHAAQYLSAGENGFGPCTACARACQPGGQT